MINHRGTRMEMGNIGYKLRAWKMFVKPHDEQTVM